MAPRRAAYQAEKQASPFSLHCHLSLCSQRDGDVNTGGVRHLCIGMPRDDLSIRYRRHLILICYVTRRHMNAAAEHRIAHC